MSIQDRIAKRLLAVHSGSLPRKISASGWWTSVRESVDESDKAVIEAHSAKVVFGDKLAKLTCEVASDDESQTVGLQKYASLPNGYGMIFPYSPPRPKIAFHMGTVPFPIDIIYVGQDNRVTKIVADIEPGTRGAWSMSHVAAVIEANAGFCRQYGIEVGTEVSTGLDKQAQLTEFSPDTASRLFPEAVAACPASGAVQFYSYMDTIGMCPMESDDPEMYWDGARWVAFGDSGYDVQAAGGDPTDGDDANGNIEDVYEEMRKDLDTINDKPGPMDGDANAPYTVTPEELAHASHQFTLAELECAKRSNDPESVKARDLAKAKYEELEAAFRGSTSDSMNAFDKLMPEYWGQPLQQPIEHKRTFQNGRSAQEVFTPDPRKDINPKMVTPVMTDPSDRFKGHDTPDNILDNQPMDGGHWDSQMGHDPSMAEQQDLVPPIRASARKIKK
jgi:uncharacterized membrane protein (UPF0127 family)